MKVNYIALYGIALGLFLALDGLWLGLIAKNLYATELKDLMTKDVKWAAAALFYLIFLVGLVYFVIAPTVKSGGAHHLAFAGALFGLVTYATYDLTNYATLKGFPLKIVLIDLAWGTLVSFLVSSGTYAVYTKLF